MNEPPRDIFLSRGGFQSGIGQRIQVYTEETQRV